MNGTPWIIIGGLIGALIAHVLGPYLNKQFGLKTKLAESYLAPFKEWCADSYEELREFNTRYLEKDFSHISSLQIIVDYRELHETLRRAHRWIGKIAKEKDKVADNLSELIEIVDPFWHSLENDYPRDLPSEKDVRLFETHIKSLPKARRDAIAKEIRNHVKTRKKDYRDKQIDIDSILTYLKNEVP